MKKILKIFFVFLFAVILFSFKNIVEANSIQKISMDIFVKDNGDAQVTEVWNCNATQGTEVYHPYYNLQTSEIKNLTVSEGNTKYTTISTWNTSGTLSSKAYKCGINKISNGVELCWGISSYGNHTYTVKYTITNFVTELTDSQMIYWTLIPYEFSNPIGNVYIKIHTNFNIADTTDIWGYGNYGGTAYIYDGYIEMQSDGGLETNEYMTILVKFPKGTFNTKDRLNYNFDYYYNMAKQGAYKYTTSSKLNNDYKTIRIFYMCFLGYAAFIVIVAIGGIIFGGNKQKIINKLDFGVEGKNMPKNLPYYREIPCNKDIFRAYYIGYQYGIIENKTDILGAIILKWLKDSFIKIEQKETGNIFEKENMVVVLEEVDHMLLQNERERELFQIMYDASKDGYLENKEFEEWCSKSYEKILLWFDRIIVEEQDKLINEGLITLTEKNKSIRVKNKKYTATKELKQEAICLAGLKKYLKVYSLIKEKRALEVHLLEEYLIFAQLMGMAQKVAKEFKELYPETIKQSSLNSYDNIIFINVCANHGIKGVTVAKSLAEERARRYSSGGGGFSSGGGGGGSRGGGSGGGGFR